MYVYNGSFKKLPKGYNVGISRIYFARQGLGDTDVKENIASLYYIMGYDSIAIAALLSRTLFIVTMSMEVCFRRCLISLGIGN